MQDSTQLLGYLVLAANGQILVLTLADCKRMVELKFPVTSARVRKQSLAKIDLLAEVVNHFRNAVHAEAKLIEKQTD